MNFLKKWYTYQKERFPVLTYGLYCFTIVFGTFCYSNCKCGSCIYGEPVEFLKGSYKLLIPMFIVGFLQFLMVRIIDEFKDYEEDCKYRPYRPVPRGLVTLKELKVLFNICAILQIIITYIVNPPSLILLALVWLFFFVMTKGFFIKKILDRHILLEVLLDEFMLPITVIFISSFVCSITSINLLTLLAMVYVISWLIEISRKVRCKEKEEEGVKTYTAVFGIFKATLLVWLLETILLGIITYIVGFRLYIVLFYALLTIVDILFVSKKTYKLSKCVEYLADFYAMTLLVSLVLLLL